MVNDKRRIDPQTGGLREGLGGSPASPPAEPADQSPAEAPAGSSELEAARQEAAERTADLQRVSAEYANYRKRVDRDRETVASAAKARVLTELLSVLDDLDRASAHGDLTGAFKTVADKLTASLEKLGLGRFAAPGDQFDPARYEAVHFTTSPDVTEQTVAEVLRQGYTVDDRLVRPAVVVVVGPGEDGGADAPTAAEGSAQQ